MIAKHLENRYISAMTHEIKNPPVLQMLVMPSDLNNHGTLFGGTLLAWLDQAGAVIAASAHRKPIMLAGIKDVDFAKPAYTADHISIAGEITEVGKTSIHVYLEATRRSLKLEAPEVITSGTYVYVTIDGDLKKVPVKGSETQI
jgi:acyl-CoA hydrolase